MFDNYIFTENSCHNVLEGDKTIGYELTTLIPYYRGIPLSMIHDIEVQVDEAVVDKAFLQFSVDGEDWFTLSELATVSSYKWEYGQQGKIRVLQDGGLSKGDHQVSLTVAVRVAYIPVPFGGTRIRKVAI